MKQYNKPVLRASQKNDFVFTVMEAYIKKTVTCRGCSSCHACRG